MSVSVSVLSPDCCSAHSVQLTYNYTPALREAGAPAWKFLDAMPALQTGVLLDKVLLELQTRRATCEPLIKGGGEWGTWDSMVESLSELIGYCTMHPDAMVRVDG